MRKSHQTNRKMYYFYTKKEQQKMEKSHKGGLGSLIVRLIKKIFGYS